MLLLLGAFLALSANGASRPCPPEMVAVARFCIDRFEAPNEAGANPLTAWTAIEGEIWCGVHGKRLCTENEWVRACEGPSQLPYPYGPIYERGRCNDEKEWREPNWSRIARYPAPEGRAEVDRLYQADPSGSNRGCVSAEGVYDLTGNAAEWVRRSRTRPDRPNYSHVMKGCYWAGCYGGAHPSCEFVNPAHSGTFRSYEAGFRCCRAQN